MKAISKRKEVEDVVNLNKSLQTYEEHTGVLDVKSNVTIKSKDDLARVYTPGIAELAKIIGKNEEMKNKYTISGKLVALISDGTAVLGLGNIGPSGSLPIVEGKALIYKELSGVDALPLALNPVSIDEFVKTIKNISKSFSGIHLEDISAPRCFEIEKKLKKELDIPVYHDDQTGTAIVVLAALINALKIVKKDTENVKILINGLGASGLATAQLLFEYGITNISLVDIYGKVNSEDERYNSYQREFASKVTQSEGETLNDLIKDKDVFIGLSDRNVLSVEQAASMADKSIVFALANPIPEISPQEAKKAGVEIIATGSSEFPNQVNNVLVFPGLFKGLLKTKRKTVDYGLQIQIAKALSSLVEVPAPEQIIADIFEYNVVETVVTAVKEYPKD